MTETRDRAGKESARDDVLDRLRSALERAPGDLAARLALARRLFALGEVPATMRTLAPIEKVTMLAGTAGERQRWAEAISLLARAEELEGRTDKAAERWETLLADDIDHPEARASLVRLSRGPRARTQGLPQGEHGAGPLRGEATLFSPEGAGTGRHELIAELGRGATSTVYLARDVHLGLEVALKVLHPAMHAASRAQARERFFWEARAAAHLRHPGVVAVYDLDEHQNTLAMEYLPAGTLRARLSTAALGEPGPLAPDEILATAGQLLDTLAYVHASGLIHGDLKPRNILLRRVGVPVLGDFGVSRLLQDDEQTRELPAGTPLYLAPEQLRGAPSSIASDLFALGAIVWEMAAGRPMRTRADLTSGRYDPVPLPAAARAHLGPLARKVGALVSALTELDPERRPADARRAQSWLDG